MMRTLKKPAALLLCGCFLSLTAFAQSPSKGSHKWITKEETVVIKNPDAGGRTVVEIKDGTIYVNGRSIMSVRDEDATRVHKKIIVESGPNAVAAAPGTGDAPEPEFRRMPDWGSPARPQLGVMSSDARGRQGAFVQSVLPGSAADSAGLQQGDIITRGDGQIIADAAALTNTIRAQHQPSDAVSIRYERQGHEYNTKARLGQMPAEPFASSWPGEHMRGDFFRNLPQDRWNPFFDEAPGPSGPRLGVSVENRRDGNGVQVLHVNPGSAAAKAGIQNDDCITQFNGQALHSVSELQAALRDLKPGQKANMVLLRRGKEVQARVEFLRPLQRKEL